MAIIRDTYEMDPYSNSLFLFCGRRCDRIKALHFEKDGFCLLYKRLDNGRFQWPRNPSEVRNLTRQEYRWLLEGLSIDQPKAIRPSKKKDFWSLCKREKIFPARIDLVNLIRDLSSWWKRHCRDWWITLFIFRVSSSDCVKQNVFYKIYLAEAMCFPHSCFVKMTIAVRQVIRFSAGFPV